MRLIHCSDLHLDSRMESNLTARQARERKAEVCASFGRLVSWARENQVDGVLIAGDMFDTRRVSVKTVDFVLDTVANAPEVEFFYLRGNHDGGADPFADRQTPENLHRFGGDWTTYRRGGVCITAAEPEGELCYDTLKLSPEDTNIVMLHGQVSTQPGADRIALPLLRGKSIDYLALGHIHSFQQERLDDRGSWCYCGCLEGRGFDECGEKGFVLLDIESGAVNPTFVPFAARRLWEVAVDISDLVTVTQLRSAMEAAAESIPADDLVKFTLTGAYTPETQKDPAFLAAGLSQRFWFVKIKDESRFRIERSAYEHDASLKGEFIRMVMASDKTEEEKARIICAGLQALAGEEVTL